ncbi:MAG TPA: chemotaxis protein CheW [Ohtaekwangia sp.]|uniref:chemotaxis protein CheW n=1 Tax=Ohtaekwangia sp. TaxID=2066019 RepID=UPI002F93C2B6
MPHRAIPQAYLTFLLGDEKFAIHVDHVQEIIELKDVTRIPDTPHYMLGIINLRGKVLPLLDTRMKLGLPSLPSTSKNRILVLNIRETDERVIQVGALVDTAREVNVIEQKQIQQPADVENYRKATAVTGIVNDQGDITMILDVNKVFALQGVEIVSAAE